MRRTKRWRPPYPSREELELMQEMRYGGRGHYPFLQHDLGAALEAIEDSIEWHNQLKDKIKKEMEEGKKKDDAKKKPTFSGSEQLGLIVVFSLVSGFVQYWAIYWAVASLLAK